MTLKSALTSLVLFNLPYQLTSDYSTESATKYNLPYDTESDGYDASAYTTKRKGIKSQECVAEPKHAKSTKLITVDQRHGSASPQSDITEHTESVSYVDSIIDSTNYGSALKQKEIQHDSLGKGTTRESCEPDVKPNLLTTDQETTALQADAGKKLSADPVESTQVKKRPKSKTTVTKVNLHKQTPIDITKRSTKTVDIRVGNAESTVTVTKSTTTSSRVSTTSARTHGYMQSTLSRDQKVLRPLTLTDSTHSSPSKTSYRTAAAPISSSQTTTTYYSPSHPTERKPTKSPKTTAHPTQSLHEASAKVGASGSSVRKMDVKDTKSTSKSSRTSSSTVVSTSSTVSSQSRSSRSTSTTTRRSATAKYDTKEQHVVKKADKEQANLVTKSTLPAAVKTSKDRVNKSLIPVKVQSSKRESTPSPSRVPKTKSKSAPSTKTTEQKGHTKPASVSEKPIGKKEHSVQLITKSIPKVTSTVRKESAKQIIDDVYRCKSAMHYSYKDAVTFDHAEVPSSLPSSPSRLNKSSSNSTNVLTSEVFTRTIDSSKSIEVIYKQPSTSHELYRRVNEYRYNDADMNFIETTDSSLSDSIALPSSSSEQESDATGKLKRSASPEGSPKQTSSSSAVTTMTTLTSKKAQALPHHPHHHHAARPSKHGITTSGKQLRHDVTLNVALMYDSCAPCSLPS
uniref:Uncharacterized protein n=1 Tax=Anopheles maculatus TaxID=74869 RepID=A0A182T6A2_9DIPT